MEVHLDCWEYMYFIWIYLELVVFLLSIVLLGTHYFVSTLG